MKGETLWGRYKFSQIYAKAADIAFYTVQSMFWIGLVKITILDIPILFKKKIIVLPVAFAIGYAQTVLSQCIGERGSTQWKNGL